MTDRWITCCHFRRAYPHEQGMPRNNITREDPVFIVLNVGSGRGDAQAKQAAIQGVLEEAGQRHEVFIIDDSRQLSIMAQHAVELAQQQQGIVVAAGGDGTINAVAQAVLNSGRPFGVLPQGTFNYFSRTHGIPADTTEATKALLNATVRPVQVGLINGRVFLVNASLGLHPQLLEDREAYKKQFGRSRLVAFWSGLMTILREHRQLVIQLELAGKTQIVRTSTLVVSNNMLQLEQIGIPEANALQQGQLAAITVRPGGTLAMLWLLVRGVLGQLGQVENVVSFAFECLTVRPWLPYGRRRIKVATDGEVTWLSTPLVFEVAPNPLLLLVPTRDATGADDA
jgi:diacylglycerol kinase family enzyme